MPNIDKVWVRVCPVNELPDGLAKNLHINGQRLVVARSGENAYIMQGYCSHMLFPLKDAKIDDCVITCNLHGSQFDVRDGHVVRWPLPVAEDTVRNKTLRTFETRVEGGILFVAWPGDSPDKVRIRF